MNASKRKRIDLVIKLYGAATGKTRKEIANELDISDSMLSLLMAGKRQPGRGLRIVLADWLLEGDL